MNILVTDYDYSGENVMILGTGLIPQEVEMGLKARNQTFEEVYEVEDKEVKYYCYDPLFANRDFDDGVRQLIY